MKSPLFQIIVFCTVISLFVLANKADKHSYGYYHSDVGCVDNPAGRKAWEYNRLKDPVTGRIPKGICYDELQFAQTLPSDADISSKNLLWVARGPYNVGGRTRGAAVDIANENIIMAGGVSGGLWRTTDGGASWGKVTPADQLHNVTTLAQDQRPGHTNNWYFGSGESYGNSAGATGAYFVGNGLYKSTDNGLTWSSLPATASNTFTVGDSLWDYVWRVAVDPSNLSDDVLYAATMYAIYRSSDGGNSWTKVLNGADSNGAYFTDVAVTTLGVVYATLSSGSIKTGIWRSADGINWTKITGASLTGNYNRVVMGINPSNENEIYFFANTPGVGQMSSTFTSTDEWNSLWKYTYLSGDGSGAGCTWVNLSQNLPNNGATTFDNLYVQGSYDMAVAVKPDEPNVVFLGGTNVYRSTDGFTSTDNIKQIGGYRIGSYFPNWGVYANHHPDQHGFIFLPSNPDEMITYNDGGMYKTNNCMQDTVSWVRLNNGYRNSQVYTIFFNKAVNNDILLAGFQDNGNYFTNTANPTVPWVMPLNGDGSFGAISNNGNDYFLSIQNGKIYKMAIDTGGVPLGFSRIDPMYLNGYQFINPFVLDPNNNDYLYVPGGRFVWRNDMASQLPLAGNHDSISTGWFKFTHLAYGNITAVSVSKNPANILYVGTTNHKLHRTVDANIGNPLLPEISSSQFSGNITCVALDPRDGNKILVVISNYATYSLWYSADAGIAWQKVAGNLEQNPDGSGNGPSCRWASILPLGNKTLYMVGTSVGLFATDTLINVATTWTQVAAETIGNVVVDMVESRESDGLVVVGTHGNGIYSTHITSVDVILGTPEERNFVTADFSVYPNPAIDFVHISINGNAPVDYFIEVYDMNGKLISGSKRFKNSNKISVNIANFPAGKYFCKLNSNGKSKVIPFVKL